MIVIAASPRFSTMCTCRGRKPEGRAGAELLGRLAEVQAARACGHEDDLVVQVVVPRRLARRDVAGEERRAGRAVVRPEEKLERARARRLLLVGRVQRDDELPLPHRGVQIRARPGRHHDELECVGRLERRALTREHESRAPGPERRGALAEREHAGARRHEQQRVELGVADRLGEPGRKRQSAQREHRVVERRDHPRDPRQGSGRRSTTSTPRTARRSGSADAPSPRSVAVACRFGELSQQPIFPHCRHMRRCTHRPSILTHSSHWSGASGSSVTAIESRWEHVGLTRPPALRGRAPDRAASGRGVRARPRRRSRQPCSSPSCDRPAPHARVPGPSRSPR